jgi:hypothetical protein
VLPQDRREDLLRAGHRVDAFVQEARRHAHVEDIAGDLPGAPDQNRAVLGRREAEHEPGAGSHAAAGDGAAHWDYDGDEGPASWGQLSPAYSACAKGRSQSPIDLPSVNLDDLDTPTLDHNPADFEAHPEEHPEEVRNSGHTIQVDFDDGALLGTMGSSWTPAPRLGRGPHRRLRLHRGLV